IDIQYFIRSQWVLVQQGTKGEVKLGQLSFEGGGALEESFDADSPEFLGVGGGIGVEEGRLAGLNALEDGTGCGREFGKPVVKGIVAAVLDREVDIGERMSHLVKPDVLAVGIVREFADEMVPGKVDAVLADMAFERHIIEPKAILVSQDVDGPEI